VDAIRAGISFFSTLKAGGDFDSLRRNLYVVPAVGGIMGLLMAIPGFFAAKINAGFAVILVYIALEGINHIDGLSDFFDAVFAPPPRKITALKDINSGTGGHVAVSAYLILLALFFSQMNEYELIYALILSQVMAKQGMLHLTLHFNPLWNGIMSEFTKYRQKRDFISYIFTAVIAGILAIHFPARVAVSVLAYFILISMFFAYVKREFGGINGDMAGALNCMIFVTVIGVWACLPW